MNFFTYNFGSYHLKYMEPIRKLFDATEVNKFNLPEDSVIITNSVYSCDGITYSTPIKMSERGNIVITLGHSLVMQNDHYMSCQSEFKCYNMLPTWKGGQYFGHYMSLYHYETPPKYEQDDSMLILVQPQTSISSISNALFNDKRKIRIRLHPGIHENRHDIPKNRIRHSWNEWKALEAFGAEIIDNEAETVADSIDKSKYIYGAFPSSTVIEAGIRGAIYRREKFLCYNGSAEQIPMNLGIPVMQEPDADLFKRMNLRGISRYILGSEHQYDSIYNSMNSLIGAIKCQ